MDERRRRATRPHPEARPEVRLRKDLERSIRAGHPWLFADALELPPLPSGTVVDVVQRDGRFVARGLLDAGSPIAVRVWTLDPGEEVGPALVARRLESALASRAGVVDRRETDAFRWCNGEGDRVPGLVVDVYGPVAVVRVDTVALRPLLPAIAEAILRIGEGLGVRHVYERSRGARGSVLLGPPPPVPVEVRELGVRMTVDVVHGQKTGTFLDQRENRRAIRPFAANVDVANLFAYTGGFSLHAALAGARRVVSVDQAAPALETARANFALNGLDRALHELVAADAFDWLREATAAGRRFGLVVVDPPSFAPSEKSLSAAHPAYRRLFAAALGVVAEGGVLAAASCSSHVTGDRFLTILAEASAEAARPLRLLEVRGQPGDHPSLPAFPEGRYLKFVLARVG